MSGLTSFRWLTKFPETHVSSLDREESWFPGFYWTVRPTLNKHLKRSLPSPIGLWEGPWVFCLKWRGYRDSLTRSKVGFPWSGLNAGSSFISQDEGMSESSVETLEKAVGLGLIWTGGITSLWHMCRVHHEKCWTWWNTSWNQDCQEKYQ